MATARVPQTADAATLAEQIIEAAIFTGVYRRAADAYPVTWQMGVKFIREGERHHGYMLLLTALVGVPGAAHEMTTALLAALRGDV